MHLQSTWRDPIYFCAASLSRE